MKARCYQLNNCKYSDYHGRGICVCDEWTHDYIAFRNWALNNGYSDNLTLDRIDNNGNYCPENCRWADCPTSLSNRIHLLCTSALFTRPHSPFTPKPIDSA